MKKRTAMVIALMLVLSLLTACAGNGQGSGTTTSQPTASQAPTEAFTYPIPGNKTLTYFGSLHKNVATQASSFADMYITQLWFEKTGVTVEFNTPPAGMEDEQLNMMLASTEYTDIMCYNWNKFNGGVQKLYKDGVIYNLTDHLAGWMPNLKAFLDANDYLDKQVKDDNSQYFSIPFFKQGAALLSTTGPHLRKDILDKLGMESPQTVDQWEKLYAAVKANYPDMYPFVGTWSELRSFYQGAFDISDSDWYVDTEGKVHYAPLEPGYKEFIQLMIDFFNKGYIDPNFPTYDTTMVVNQVSAGQGFSMFGSSLDKCNAANKDNGDYLVVGEKRPTFEPGKQVRYVCQYEFGSNNWAVVSTDCKDLELAMRVYDWGFSEEGYRTLNWGIEGKSYTVGEDGLPYYTDLILHNPDGLSVAQALAWYVMAGIKGPAMLAQDERYMIQYYSEPIQVEALAKWGDIDMTYRRMPNVSRTDEENSVFVTTMADLDTYVQSNSIKMVIGTESIDNWDNFINTIKNMGIEEVIKVQQQATDRYNAR